MLLELQASRGGCRSGLPAARSSVSRCIDELSDGRWTNLALVGVNLAWQCNWCGVDRRSRVVLSIRDGVRDFLRVCRASEGKRGRARLRATSPIPPSQGARGVTVSGDEKTADVR